MKYAISEFRYEIPDNFMSEEKALVIIRQVLDTFLSDDPEGQVRVLSMLFGKAQYEAAAKQQVKMVKMLQGIMENAKAIGVPVTIPPDLFSHGNPEDN